MVISVRILFHKILLTTFDRPTISTPKTTLIRIIKWKKCLDIIVLELNY